MEWFIKAWEKAAHDKNLLKDALRCGWNLEIISADFKQGKGPYYDYLNAKNRYQMYIKQPGKGIYDQTCSACHGSLGKTN